MARYIVDVRKECREGAEVQVEASSREEALRKVQLLIEAGADDEFDWNYFYDSGTEIHGVQEG